MTEGEQRYAFLGAWAGIVVTLLLVALVEWGK
jgi:hypothetical protein